MLKNSNKWIGAYYPNEIIYSPHSRAIFGLIFDKIICHFPITDMACGGGEGISEEFSGDTLVKEGVLELREELLLPEIEADFWDNSRQVTDQEFNKHLQWQVTKMALNTCSNSRAIPVTDNPRWPVPASIIKHLDLPRHAQYQATALAIHSLELAIPPIAAISDSDILELRNLLKEQLIPFRHSMLILAPTVRDGIDTEASLTDVFKEAKYIVETNIAPTLNELQKRLSKEKGKFWRRIILKSTIAIPKFVLNWATKGALLAAMDSIGDTKELVLDIGKGRDYLTLLKSHGGFGYLLNLINYPKFKRKGSISKNK